jgi:hypothetical protein
MAKKDTSVRYSRNLGRMVTTRTVACASVPPRLTPADIRKLDELLNAEPGAVPSLDRKQAVLVLAQAAPTAASAETLGRILANQTEDTALRVTAAANLALIEHERAEQALLPNLDSADHEVRGAVIDALARVGSVVSLQALGALRPRHADERRRLDLARHAIAYRVGTIDGLPRRTSPWQTQPIQVVRNGEAAALVDAFWGPHWGIELDRSRALTLDCGGIDTAVLLNSGLRRAGVVNALRERPWVAALIVRRDGGTPQPQYTLHALLLSRPGRAGVALDGFLPSGEQVLAGAAHESDDGLQVMVRDVGPARAAMRVEGQVRGDELTLQVDAWRGSPRAKRTGLEATGV